MKKILILLLLCLFLLSGCRKNGNGVEESSNKINSVYDFNSVIKGRLSKPTNKNVSDETYEIEETAEGIIAQYSFKIGETQYIIKFSDTIMPKDISGIMVDGNPVFEEDYSDVRASGEGCKLARWFTTDGQYVLIVPDNLDDNLFNSILDEIATASVPQEN